MSFKNIILVPNFVEYLNAFEASHESPQGKMIASWKRVGEKVSFVITFPANETATVLMNVETNLPIQKQYSVVEKSISITHKQLKIKPLSAGTYQFEIQ